MKEITVLKPVYLEKYDVNVEQYITLGQIQQIVTSLKNFKTWGERQTNIDMLLLFHVTDIPAEELNKITHDDLLKSGLIDAVKEVVINYSDIEKAINQTESMRNAIIQIAEMFKSALTDKLGEKHGKTNR